MCNYQNMSNIHCFNANMKNNWNVNKHAVLSITSDYGTQVITPAVFTFILSRNNCMS